jgi:nucleoside-diphosphate-sugar epimerase
MNVLIIGGTRFVGYLLTWRLIAAGARVTLFNRGTRADPFGSSVQRIAGDRTADLSVKLRGCDFDAVVDFAAYTGPDVQQAINVFSNHIRHYVFISTGQVYLVRTNCPRPAKESDYDGPVMLDPGGADHPDWLYGIGKRAAEDALIACQSQFPSTRLRIPMVNGERDYYRRIESYLWRMLDGGPVLLPTSPLCRHVYGFDVADTIVQILGDTRTFGQAYNLCQEEEPTLQQLLEMLAAMLGIPSRLVPISPDKLAEHHLPLKDVSPFSDPWMSRLDPARAKNELGFRHQPLERYLEKVVASFLAHPPQDRPANYAHRAAEIALPRGK